MKRLLLVVILSFVLAFGAVELISKEGGGEPCHCFDEGAAIQYCNLACSQRGTSCVGVIALACSCSGSYCRCKYYYVCHDQSYGYGYVYSSCAPQCP